MSNIVTPELWYTALQNPKHLRKSLSFPAEAGDSSNRNTLCSYITDPIKIYSDKLRLASPRAYTIFKMNFS